MTDLTLSEFPAEKRLPRPTSNTEASANPFVQVQGVPAFPFASTTSTQAPPRRLSPSPRGISGSDRLSSLAAFVSEKTYNLTHRASHSSSSSSSSNTTSTTSTTSTLDDDSNYHHSFASPSSTRTLNSSSQKSGITTDNTSITTIPTNKNSLPRPLTPHPPTTAFTNNNTTSPTTKSSTKSSGVDRNHNTEKFGFTKKLTRRADTTHHRKKTTSTEGLLDSSEEYPQSGQSTKSGSPSCSPITNKMHQTSSRLLRMTDDERPYTRDFKDLFSTLIVSLPLTTHRNRFKSYPFSFTSEEAINNLGSLKFSQSNRMPDPKDPSRIVTTTTTTTFSMAKEMARSVCQRFMDARFIELADGKSIPMFPLKGSLWQLTPKGIHILERFCQRNGIQQEHVLKLLQSPFNTMRLVILERDVRTDKLSHDKTTTEVLFRRFSGNTPNVKPGSTVSDNDSISEHSDGINGVKLADTRKIYDKVIKNSFTGKCAVDWLLDCCTIVERSEAYEVITCFVTHGLIQSVLDDKAYIQQHPTQKDFQPTKNAIYIFTEKGKRVAGWIEPERMSLGERNSDGARTSSIRNRDDHSPRGYTDQRETNTTRLTAILNDAALRLLYREFLRATLCEENLAFYLDVVEFNKNFHAIDLSKSDAVRETLAAAYGLYNAFLAPGSPCELNIDHTLRQDMASRMTRAVATDDRSMYGSLKEVAGLFERAQSQVFKLMAGDSVPKFIRTQKYMEVAGDMLDDERIAQQGVNRSASRSVRYNGGKAAEAR